MSAKPQYPYTPAADKIIRDAYASPDYSVRRKKVPEAVQKLGWDRRAVYYRAVELGVVQPSRKEPRWTSAEEELLEKHAHKTATVIAQIFRRHGFSRSPAGIATRRFLMQGGLTQARITAGLYTAHQAALLLGVTDRTVCYWINQGLLKAHRRGGKGGVSVNYWEISERDIRQFIIDNTALVNFQKVDKYWVVDVLTQSSKLKKPGT